MASIRDACDLAKRKTIRYTVPVGSLFFVMVRVDLHLLLHLHLQRQYCHLRPALGLKIEKRAPSCRKTVWPLVFFDRLSPCLNPFGSFPATCGHKSKRGAPLSYHCYSGRAGLELHASFLVRRKGVYFSMAFYINNSTGAITYQLLVCICTDV